MTPRNWAWKTRTSNRPANGDYGIRGRVDEYYPSGPLSFHLRPYDAVFCQSIVGCQSIAIIYHCEYNCS